MEHPSPARRKLSHGFTLVELLVVVVILIIVAAIAVPVFLNQKTKAQTAVASTTVANVTAALATGQSTNGSAAITNDNLVVTDGSGATQTLPLGDVTVVAAGAAVNPVNNLLNANQANPTSVGAWSTASTEVAPGSYRNPTAAMWVAGSRDYPVTGGKTYTLRANITTGPVPAYVVIYWYRGDGSHISGSVGSTVAASTSGTSILTTLSPADATSARVHAFHSTSPAPVANSGPWTISNVGFWRGASTTFVAPGASASVPLSAGGWCVALQDPGDTARFLRQKPGEKTPTSVVAASAVTAYA